MKLTIDLVISCKHDGANYTFGAVRRTYDTNLVPVEGMMIDDSAWKNSRRIEKVTMIMAENSYYVWVGDDEEGSKERAYQRVQMYKSHDWEVLYCGDV